MKLIITIAVAILAIPIAFFIGKTNITDGGIEVERPLTAVFFYLTILASLFDK